jgi:hypothetical protein
VNNKPSRGIRNQNPGNLRRSKDRWQGLSAQQTDPEFFTFDSPIYGIRALARVLIVYHDRRFAEDGSAIDTIEEIIARWAPPNENDTGAYIRAVVKRTGFAPGEALDLHRHDHLRPLVEAIIRHENGAQPYSGAEIDKALSLAGVEPAPQPLAASRTVRGGQVAAGGTVAAAAIEGMSQLGAAQDALSYLVPYLDAARWALLLVILAGVGLTLYARWDDKRRGVNP